MKKANVAEPRQPEFVSGAAGIRIDWAKALRLHVESDFLPLSHAANRLLHMPVQVAYWPRRRSVTFQSLN